MDQEPPAKHTNILQEEDVHQAPMPDAHKKQVLIHFNRLKSILDNSHENSIKRRDSKQAAREKLARMTLVFRDYAARQSRGEFEDGECECMVTDVIDTCIFADGGQGSWDQPVFASPFLMGREQEVAALVQELEAGDTDDVIELWNAPRSEHAVQDTYDLGAGIDWNRVLVRSRSEDNIVRYRPHRNVKDRPKFTRKLSERRMSDWDHLWPPTPAERQSYISRLRSNAEGIDEEDWDQYNTD